MIKIKKVYISLFTLSLILICIFCGAIKFFMVSYLSLALHELFHIAAANKLNIQINRIVILPFGINIKTTNNLSYANEILFCIAGPVANALLFLVILYLKINGFTFEMTDYALAANLSIFIINILPIYPLDGGRIFKRILEEKTGHYKSANISIWVSQFFVLTVCVFIFCAILTLRFNISIMVLCCFLIYSVSEQKNSAALAFSKLLLYSEQKLEKADMLPVREIAVTGSSAIKDVLKLLSDSAYIMITVTDKKGKTILRLSETMLIKNALQGHKYIYELV